MATTKTGLRAKIKEIGAQAGASMIPVGREVQPPAPPQKKEEVIPDIKDLVKDQRTRLQLARDVSLLGDISQQKSALSKQYDALSKKVKVLFGSLQTEKAISGEWRINYFNAPRRTIDKDKLTQALLARNIQPAEINDIIQESTKVSDAYTLKVSELGVVEDEE